MSKGFDLWKVLVYVKSCSEKGQFREKICVELETTTWIRPEKSPYIWHRKDRIIEPLTYRVCWLDQENKCIKELDEVNTPVECSLYAQDGVIHFKQNHFLRIEGLIPPANSIYPDLDPGIERKTSPYNHKDVFSARNIHTETIFEVSRKSTPPKFSPLFYLDQETDDHGICNHAVRFGEIYDLNYRQIYWQISGQHPIETEKFQIDGNCHEYMLTISQDKDRRLKIDDSGMTEEKIQEELEKLPVYFEFYADAVPLPMAKLDSADDLIRKHIFDSTERLLYIGYDPELNTTFEGSMRRLMFNPNSSCDNC